MYAAGLTPETTFRKKVLYNILYKLLQLFWPVEKYLCFKRHVGPIVQKGRIVNTSLSWGRKQTRFYTTDCTHHPSIHPSHEINNIHFMKSTRLHIKYREDKIFALGSRDINDYLATMILRDSEAEDKEYEHGKKKKDWEINLIYSVERRDVVRNNLEEEHKSPQRKKKKKNVHKVSHKMYLQHFLISIKMSTCSRNSPLKKCYIYNLYICI